MEQKTKFCKHCGEKIPEDAILCTYCGRQVEELKSSQPNIVINNSNDSVNTNTNQNTNINSNAHSKNEKNKWIAFILCLFFGYFGIHKFYEGKIGLGVLYFFTFGLFGIGWIIDMFILFFKPNPYYV